MKSGLKAFKKNLGFTLIEVVVIITTIAILVSITIVRYDDYQTSTTIVQLKSDLSGVNAAMEDYRNFNDIYPNSVPTSFRPSNGVVLTGGSTDGGLTYCVDASNPSYPNLYYHIRSLNSVNEAQPGTCAATSN